MITQKPSRAVVVTVPGLVLGLAITVLACASKQKTAESDGSQADTSAQAAEPTPPSMTDPASPMQPEPGEPDPMFACAQDTDCTVLEMGCCDHCNGGWQLAVNTGQTVQANSQYHEPSCTGTACTKRGCVSQSAPVCDGGVCARREEEPQPDGKIKATIVRNVLPAR